MRKFILIILFLFSYGANVTVSANEITEISLSNNAISGDNLSLFLQTEYQDTYPVNFQKVTFLDAPMRQISFIGDLSFLPNLKYFYCGNNNVKSLEDVVFQSTIKSIVFLGNPIVKISNLDNLVNLECLWFRYGWIKKIENLENLTNLKDLDLSYNSIHVIEGLEGLTSLESFQIAENKITDYSGLLVLKNLKVINIIGKNHVQDEKSKTILLQVIKNNPDADLLGFDWVLE